MVNFTINGRELSAPKGTTILNAAEKGVDFVKALDKAGFPDVAQNIYNMLRQKVAGDYLHTASIFGDNFHVLSAVNVPNDYHGPMTGYQISEERWKQISDIPNAIRPEDI